MTDVHTREQRSRNMAAIRSRIRSRKSGCGACCTRWGSVSGFIAKICPDGRTSCYRSTGRSIFVHGCFWHCHRCKYGSVVPATRADFWAAKRGGNVARDRRHAAALRRLGWRVAVLWECEVRTDDAARAAVRKLRLGR